MIAPIDYSLNVEQPFQAAMRGYAAGAAIRDDQAQQQALLAQQQAQQQKAQVIRNLIGDPNAGADQYSQAMLVVPELKDQLKQAWDTKSTAQQQAHLSDMTQWASAIQNGQPQIAVDAMRQRADAMEAQNGGPTQESQALRAHADVIEEHPDFGGFMMKAALMAAPGGDKVVDSIVKMGQENRAQELQPGAVRKANADALDAETKAKYEEDVIKTDLEARRQSGRIAAMQVALSKESNDLKRSELQMKINEAKDAFDEKVRTRAADVETARSSIDNVLDTIDRIKKNPSLNDVVGSLEGSSLYPNSVAGVLNPFSSSDEKADAIALIDSLGSQATLAQLPAMKGTGTITDKEEEILKNSLSNLSRKQSEDQFKKNLDTVQRLLLKARKNVETRYGVAKNIPDRPNVSVPGLPPGFKILGKE